VREGNIYNMDRIRTVKKEKTLDDTIQYGYYCLPSEVCKNLIITAGLSGVQASQAVKKIRSKIRRRKGTVGEMIPALSSMDQDVISYYAGELAESLVYAAGNGKNVEIAIGYPKILVISVN
jgi:hypothetical protein